jgi:ubiquinone/menaquinone biosynthesis C-methylase UbiE
VAVDYDRVAPAYDRRYALHDYPGIRATIRAALSGERPRVLEMGYGTGKWLAELASAGCEVAGIDPSEEMLRRAEQAVAGDLRRGVAEALPWNDEAFDVVFCINAFHHFTMPEAALAEACRVLRPGGMFVSIGMDPHAGCDRWWVYEFFPETVALDHRRFPSAAQRLAWIEAAGLVTPTIRVAERLRSSLSFHQMVQDGVLEPTFTSQLTALAPAEFAGGLERIRDAARRDESFQALSDITLFVTEACRPA